ncbi:DUF4158 domain-containing protein [Streptomyces virginiae]|uniref:DUF4158 domain-containing protein n=1 Tax=Streptomyces virginiae TaxID=1961 RepID=UPI0036E332C6
MRQDWEPEDLIEVWTLLEDDMKRVRNKSGATRLGFALLLKFFEVEARFPESAKEVPAAAMVGCFVTCSRPLWWLGAATITSSRRRRGRCGGWWARRLRTSRSGSAAARRNGSATSLARGWRTWSRATAPTRAPMGTARWQGAVARTSPS